MKRSLFELLHVYLEQNVIKVPCANKPCDFQKHNACIVEDVANIPAAFCQCSPGYEDARWNDNKVLATNSTELTCVNSDECLDANRNTCNDNQNCVDTIGSYNCPCKTGWLETWDDTIPCIKCDGIGARVSNGKCICTDVDNAVLATGSDSSCTCAVNYEESNELCFEASSNGR